VPELTLHQHDAADYKSQDSCVVAGPGSGKTTVLVERYRRLVDERGFEPRNILAITFTEKAAANMKSRLADLFAHDAAKLREVEAGYVSTIHGFCARVLHDHAIAAGIDPRFSVLDARESEDLRYACLHAAFDELVEQRRAETLELIEALQEPDLAFALQSAYDGIRSAGKTVAEVRAMGNPGRDEGPHDYAARLRELVSRWPANLSAARRTQRGILLEWSERLDSVGSGGSGVLNAIVRLVNERPVHLGKVPESEKEALGNFRDSLQDLIAWALDRHTARFRAMIFDVLERFEELYGERKREAGNLDFNDLEKRTIDLLRGNEGVRRRLSTQFRQVMLDEFQDINAQQSDLIRLIRGEDVFFAVGDGNQSIYGFRHARPEIFTEYEVQIRDAGKHSSALLDNFRSRPAILRSVEGVLNGAEGIIPRELVAGASFADKSRPSIEVLKIHDADKDLATAKEARWIANRILSLRGRLQIGPNGKERVADFSDFAVLCRNGESMKPILEAFGAANIPYVCGRRQSFLLSRQGMDITALLHTIANPRDGIALATVLRSSLVGIGDESLLRVRLLAGSLSSGLNTIAHDSSKLAEFPPEDAAGLARFATDLKRWRAEQAVLPLELLIVRALSDCGFQWMPGTVIGGNVESFLHLARTRGDERGLAGLLKEIASLQKAVNLESDLADKDQGNCVQVMTAHSAKGLEFPVTIIAAMDKGTRSGVGAASFTPEFGLGLTWRDPTAKPGKAGLDDSWQRHNAGNLEEREHREANRLLYVAMTRAEEHLILSCAQTRGRTSQWVKMLGQFFHLDGREFSQEPQTETAGLPGGESFEVSIHVTAAEPPPLRADATDAATGGGSLTIPRPAVHDQHDSAVNVTSLAVFADCPRKYYLERYIGWDGRFSRFDPEELPAAADDSDELGAAELGSLVHEILAGGTAVYPAEAKQLADVFLASDLGKRTAAASRAEREWDFIVDIDGTLVRGTIDLWFEEAGRIVIVDYKTDKNLRPEAYAHQMALYAVALERALGKPPAEAWLHFLRPNTAIQMPLPDGAIHRVEDLLADLAQAQDTLSFELREAEHCRICPFHRGLCPAA
jgi:ATP-dependent helicase/nuclease subunit A